MGRPSSGLRHRLRSGGHSRRQCGGRVGEGSACRVVPHASPQVHGVDARVDGCEPGSAEMEGFTLMPLGLPYTGRDFVRAPSHLLHYDELRRLTGAFADFLRWLPSREVVSWRI
jgi:hypothetical protein